MHIVVKFSDHTTVFCGQEEIVFPTRRAKSLLVYMVIRKSASRKLLTDLLWPDSAPEAGLKSLRTTLHYIKKAFHDTAVFTSRKGTLSLSGTVDVELRYESGDLFGDLFIDGCPEFDSFLYDYKMHIERVNYEDLKGNYRRKLAGCGEKDAVAMFQALKEQSPYDESLYASLMEYYSGRGQYRKAISVYKEAARLLWEDLSVNPGRELAALYKGALECISARTDTARGNWFPRYATLDRLQAVLSAFEAGEAFSSILICAPTGAGKTALLNRFLLEIPRRCLTIFITCYEAEKNFPFWLLNQIADAIIHRFIADQKPLEDQNVRSLQQMMQYFSLENQGERMEQMDAAHLVLYHQFMESAERLFRTAAEQYPIVLCIDDIHYADSWSMKFLWKIAGCSRDRRVLLVISASSDAGGDLGGLYYQFAKTCRVEQLQLKNFSRPEIRELVKVWYPNISCGVETIFSETNGNPFLLFEYLNLTGGNQAMYASTLSVLLNNKMRSLTAEERQILQLSSYFVRRVDHAVIAGLIGKDEEIVIEGLDSLARHGFLEEYVENDNIFFRFQCERFRKCIYEDQSALTRENTHNHIARCMKSLSDGYGKEILYHYQQANNRAMALKQQIQELSALINLDVEFPEFISDISASHIDDIERELAAGDLPDDVKYEFCLMKGSFAIKMCDYSVGIRNIQRILDYDNDMARLIKAHKQMVYYAYQLRSPRAMYPHIMAALGLIKQHGIEEERADVLKLLAMYSILVNELDNADRLLNQCSQMYRARRADRQTLYNLACVLNYRASMEKYRANYSATLKYYSKAIAICEENGILNGLSVFYTNMGQMLYTLGKQEQAKKYFLKCEELYHVFYTNWSRALAEAYLALICFNEGNFRESAAYLSRSASQAARLKNAYESTYHNCVARIIRKAIDENQSLARYYAGVLDQSYAYYDQRAEDGFQSLNLSSPELRLL